MITIELTEQDAGQAILNILQQHIPAAPQSYLRQLLRRGKVCSDGIALDEESCLHGHETLQLPDSGRLRELCDSPLPKVTILLETEGFLAVFKPAGLAIHSSVNHTEDNLTDRVRAIIHHRKALYQVAPAHRLDIGTSGPVLFGKGRKSTAELGRLLQAGQIKKTYLALVHGMPPESGTLTTEVQVQDKIKEAATRFRVRGRCGHSALLEIELLSGRKHQIRQQCSDAGCRFMETAAIAARHWPDWTACFCIAGSCPGQRREPLPSSVYQAPCPVICVPFCVLCISTFHSRPEDLADCSQLSLHSLRTLKPWPNQPPPGLPYSAGIRY